ncbi:MAG: sugar nucleotide-binding protein, partial [Acetatifactor sp.]|nr:sugar nucleotide-binding protein [Acetatifactor sp.]
MKILVTGAGGQLGFDVGRELTSRGQEAVGVNHQTMDIT